jgi:hypothetical protein
MLKRYIVASTQLPSFGEFALTIQRCNNVAILTLARLSAAELQ